MSFEITHITSAHTRTDVRIFVKMCKSLVDNGYRVNLLVCDGLGDSTNHGVKILDCFAPKNRYMRIFIAPFFVLLKAILLKSHVFHLHDPELLFVGLALRFCGKKVVFDSHEDFPEQILTKHYLNIHTRKLLSFLARIFEKNICKLLSGVVSATPYINSKFNKFGINCVNINNYPLSKEFEIDSNDRRNSSEICYIGDISSIRGSEIIIKSTLLTKNKVKLILCGHFHDSKNMELCKSLDGWNNVIYLGVVERKKVHEILSSSVAGLVTFLPTQNHINSQPNKLFEYMACGLPVICSNFPLWKDIVELENCGLCVNPLIEKEIAFAIDKIIEDSQLAKQMGEYGKRAILNRYNWSVELVKLLDFYNYLMQADV